jgi:hypothetical protein
MVTATSTTVAVRRPPPRPRRVAMPAHTVAVTDDSVSEIVAGENQLF